MRAVIQRAESASVEVLGKDTRSIGQGIVVLLGVMEGDTQKDADLLAKKIAQMRIFTDDAGKMNLSLEQVGGSVLVVSNFTLGGDWRSGRRPSFIRSARPEQAIPLYEYFIEQLGQYEIQSIQTGEFGADMKLHLVNDGPVTLMMDSRVEGV